MDIVIVTGSGGLIGSESVEFFSNKFDIVVGIDNDMRSVFFGKEASTSWNIKRLEEEVSNYIHYPGDIRDKESLESVFSKYGADIKLIVHCAAQPSHDWAAKDPIMDFTVNANGTLNLLELTRNFSPEAVFIHCSTNKVYGDTPNNLPLVELDMRWEVDESHKFYARGIDESMTIDNSKHSVFGASKVAADVMVQEYGKYFGLKTVCFRGGCLTGPKHSGAMLHGFLSYLMKCAIKNDKYTIFGYEGKQVRDNIHAYDLVNMFWHFYKNPRHGEVYNAGGSRYSNCSMKEAVALCEEITEKKMRINYDNNNRIGDHIWYISDIKKFKDHYPDWSYKYGIKDILLEIYDENH
jgi:CDP-paratose 2-epimerase